MNVPVRIRVIAYILGFIGGGIWAPLSAYLAWRGLDAHAIALVSGVLAVGGAGLAALAAGHITLPATPTVSVEPTTPVAPATPETPTA